MDENFLISVFCITGPRDDTRSDQYNWKFILHVVFDGWIMLSVKYYTPYLAVFRCRIGVVPVPLGVGGRDVYNKIFEIKLQINKKIVEIVPIVSISELWVVVIAHFLQAKMSPILVLIQNR